MWVWAHQLTLSGGGGGGGRPAGRAPSAFAGFQKAAKGRGATGLTAGGGGGWVRGGERPGVAGRRSSSASCRACGPPTQPGGLHNWQLATGNWQRAMGSPGHSENTCRCDMRVHVPCPSLSCTHNESLWAPTVALALALALGGRVPSAARRPPPLIGSRSHATALLLIAAHTLAHSHTRSHTPTLPHSPPPASSSGPPLSPLTSVRPRAICYTTASPPPPLPPTPSTSSSSSSYLPFRPPPPPSTAPAASATHSRPLPLSASATLGTRQPCTLMLLATCPCRTRPIAYQQ